MKLLFLHGWGFDRHFWDALRPLLPEWEHVVDDRGYFGAPFTPQVEGPCLAVTHSFGTMCLLSAPPPGLAGIVAINGFLRFTAKGDRPGVPRRVVDLMMRQFERDPLPVLQTFREECGCGDPVGAFDADLLRADLEVLRDGEAPAPAVPVLSLEGAHDHLLHAATRDAAFSAAQITRRVHPEAGHLLPREAPQWCADAICAFAETLGA